MQVYEIRVKIFLLKNIKQEEALSYIAEFIDGALCSDPTWESFHRKNCFKNYSFNSLYPIEKSKVYQKEKVYTFIVRTINVELAKFLTQQLKRTETLAMKGLVSEQYVIPQNHITTLYTLTPIIVKGKEPGYWRDFLSFEEYQNRIKIILIKKYNQLEETKLDEDFTMWNLFELTNRTPMSFNYKKIKLLADKVQLQIADNENAQKLAYLALATGAGNICGRGAGFVNYRMIRG